MASVTVMHDLARLILLVALAGAALTFAASLLLWLFGESRAIRAALKRVLQSEPDAVILAEGRGRAAGFSFATGRCAVAWDGGRWCLIYRIDEVMGAELIIDGQVVARAFRGEPRRALDQVVSQASRVTLRLIFDDVHHPDFDLDLWVAGDETRRRRATPVDAVQEANRWMARAEAILRRPAPPVQQPAAPPPQPPAPAAVPQMRDAHADDPPWRTDADDEGFEEFEGFEDEDAPAFRAER